MSVTAAQGFTAAGVRAGIKASGNHDVALVVSQGPLFTAAGVFTSNRFKAAPVLWSQQVLLDQELRAVVLNSGGANACTGPDGFADTHHTAEFVARELSSLGTEVGPGEIAVCSTGLIGERLPMERIYSGVTAAVLELRDTGGDDAALAIMTTDSVPKTSVVERDGFVIGGMAKGAGMLAPGLATMLVVITTDAVVDAELADAALRAATAVTFDRIDSDGCMSTNDTVLLLASGASGEQPNADTFTDALTQVCADLALQLIHDAEGASKDIRITVEEAASTDDALEVARAIARSNLLKCAIHGEDPNWGRVLAAAGTTSAAFEPDAVDVAMNGVWICRNGGLGEDRSLVSLAGREVDITVVLRSGATAATVWTNDLTADYVHENSAYST
ncbi:MAG: bifunctional glutamate N-acetyltransferase/amino-acid acetyltransferase ArgJ [Candidatus Nanopelagicales bacterium]|nr:bifunctional glutamate N-acetyltransferase/amino-acid acetyltransferase ArgJ [Candidatus Nanopelagicales bacterium]